MMNLLHGVSLHLISDVNFFSIKIISKNCVKLPLKKRANTIKVLYSTTLFALIVNIVLARTNLMLCQIIKLHSRFLKML